MTMSYVTKSSSGKASSANPKAKGSSGLRVVSGKGGVNHGSPRKPAAKRSANKTA